jgi:hypothetical protein
MIAGLINLVIYLLILGVILALVFWVLQEIPLPQPINRIIRIVVIVIVVLVVIILLLQLVGGGADFRLPRIAQ